MLYTNIKSFNYYLLFSNSICLNKVYRDVGCNFIKSGIKRIALSRGITQYKNRNIFPVHRIVRSIAQKIRLKVHKELIRTDYE